MSQVVIEFGEAMAPQPKAGASAPVSSPFPQVQEITSSASSQATTITARAYDIAIVTNNGSEAIWLDFAASPTATVGGGVFIAPNMRRDIGPLGAGMKAAVINDS